MSDLDSSYTGPGGQDPRPGPEVRSMPFFPGPSTTGPSVMPSTTGPSVMPPLSAPTAAPPVPPPTVAPPRVPPQSGRHSQEREYTDPLPGGGREPQANQGRIVIEDAVVEKIATLAALEVSGVAAMGGAAADEGMPGRPPVRVLVRDDEITLDVLVAVEYGSVIMEVARVVRSNVARVASLMLGMRVAAVNVTVEDVRMPAADHL